MPTIWTAIRPFAIGVVIGATVAAIAVLMAIRPPAPVVVANSTPAIARLESAVQGLIAADRLRAASSAMVAPMTARPAIAIAQKVLPGLSAGQIEAVLDASRAPTVTTVSATSKLVGPSPEPAPTGFVLDVPTLVAADEAAITSVLADPRTHIATTVTLSQAEVEPSRLGSTFGSDGSGLTYAIVRRGSVDVNLGAVARGAHISPSLGVGWRIPHTSLSIGPRLLYDHGLHTGAAVTVLFGP